MLIVHLHHPVSCSRIVQCDIVQMSSPCACRLCFVSLGCASRLWRLPSPFHRSSCVSARSRPAVPCIIYKGTNRVRSVPLAKISWSLLEPMLMRPPGIPLTEPPGANPPVPVDTSSAGAPLKPLNFDVLNFFDPTLWMAAEPELPTPPAPALSR
jgi:hypothetical protein